MLNKEICECCIYFGEVWRIKLNQSQEEWYCPMVNGYVMKKSNNEIPFGCPMKLEHLMNQEKAI